MDDRSSKAESVSHKQPHPELPYHAPQDRMHQVDRKDGNGLAHSRHEVPLEFGLTSGESPLSRASEGDRDHVGTATGQNGGIDGVCANKLVVSLDIKQDM